ncbi:accessory Sec system S-layer assembly protein [Peribacillus sp. SCS-26]|uniref:accessory Sec system S-layer assembly protein n=1 Tax=Paraperibacillus marinus TaxID=3115295 RepID=UPI003905BF9D
MALFKLKKKKAAEKPVEQPAEIQETRGGSAGVQTSIHFHPDLEMSASESYVFRYKHQQLEGLEPNQLSITGIKLTEFFGDLVVTAFLRNTVSKPLGIGGADLLLLDKEGRPFARQQFDLTDLGELPPLSCTPWRFLFTSENVLTPDIPGDEDGWTLAFELKQPADQESHILDLDASWENQITELQREKLTSLVKGLPSLAAGEVNFMGIEAAPAPDGALAVTVLIRNGSDRGIKLEQIPLQVEDGAGDIICRGGFTLDNFEVKANTSKPWTFVFPASVMLKQNPDLSSWTVYPPEGE